MNDTPAPSGRRDAQDGVLEVSHLTKTFDVGGGPFGTQKIGVVHAVNDVSFSIDAGETLGIVGESGCGKSTTAKLVLLLERPTSGSITYRGRDVQELRGTQLREYRRSVQAVFQDPYSSLNPRMRIGDTIKEPLGALPTKLSKREADERVLECLDAVGLRPTAAGQYPHELSGGQRQRVAIARAIATKPDFIVLDEPVSALDVSIRAQVINLLQDLQEELGVGYFLIAHDLPLVHHVSTNVGVMYLGELVEIGPSDAVYERRLHPYTQALISNALPVRVGDTSEPIILRGEVPSPIDPPSGCKFRTRCPFAMPVCAEVPPVLAEKEPGHRVACHLYE